MARKVETREFGDARVTCTELDFMSAADLLPELVSVMAPMQGADNPAAAISAMAGALMGGKLVSLLPRLLKGVTVVVTEDGKSSKFEIMDAASLNKAFTGRKKLAIDVVKMALEINFSDFFDVADLAVEAVIPKTE